MPKISIATTTYRPWDRLIGQLTDLKQQTLQDIEWIVVDDLCGKREFELEASFPIVHRLPKNGVVDFFAPAHADNTALIHAKGELVFFVNDYVRLTPTILARHWELYKQFGPKVTIAGPMMPMDGQMAFDERKGDYRVGDGVEECVCGHADWHYSAGRNDSAPLEDLLELNGLDESYDGDRGGSDVDLAYRLAMNGCRRIIDRLVPCFEYAHHADSNPAYSWEKELPKKGHWDGKQTKWKPHQLRAENSWSLKEEREQVLGQTVASA